MKPYANCVGNSQKNLNFYVRSRYDLLVGVTRAESYFVFNSEDVQYGIEADRRLKIMKTYVRNTYSYHLSEILATVINEYTDWERPVQHPINIRWV
jgi:neuroligin